MRQTTPRRAPATESLRLGATVLGSAVVAATLAVGCHAGAQVGPQMPFEDQGACPIEGCAYREWIANAGLALKTERWIGAPVAFRVRKGERVTAVTGVVVTHRAGRVRFKRQVTLWSKTGPVHVEPIDTLYLLTHRSEGFTTVWLNGQVYLDLDGSAFSGATCEATPDACDATLVQKPLSAWWVQVRNAKGQVGWTNQPDRFDNKSTTDSQQKGAGRTSGDFEASRWLIVGEPRATRPVACFVCAAPA